MAQVSAEIKGPIKYLLIGIAFIAGGVFLALQQVPESALLPPHMFSPLFVIGGAVSLWTFWQMRNSSPLRREGGKLPIGIPALLAGSLFAGVSGLSWQLCIQLGFLSDPLAAVTVAFSLGLAGLPGIYLVASYLFRYFKFKSGKIESVEALENAFATDAAKIGYLVGGGTLLAMPVLGFWVGLERGQWWFFLGSMGFLLLFGSLLYIFVWSKEK